MPPEIIPQKNSNTGLLPKPNVLAPIIPNASGTPAIQSPISQNQSGNVDRDALNFTHALALKESGVEGKPNYNAIGDNGTSAGAYQWNNGKKKLAAGEIPVNFKEDAKKAGLSPDDFSPENQDKVQYATVVAKKKAGWTPAMIAAGHNAGDSKALDGSWQNNVGTVNIAGKDIHYDTPSYVAGVKQFYDQISKNQPPTTALSNAQATTPIDEEKNDDSIGSELKGRLSDAGNALKNVIGGKSTGQSRVSGLLQIGGAIGGALGDVTTKAAELIPGVKALEGWIGKGASKLAQTPVGQSVVKSIQDFSTAHPELSKDIGAGINIVTALPILDGIGAVKNVALDGTSRALKSTAEKIVTKDLANAAGKSVTKNAIDTLVKENIIPTIKKGVYDITEANAKVNALINSATNAARKMELVDAQNALTSIAGKPVQLGMMGNAIKYSAGALGEMAGEHLGVPLVGGFVGTKLGGIAEDSVGNTTKGILERSKNNIAKSANNALRGTRKTVSAGLIQKSLKK